MPGKRGRIDRLENLGLQWSIVNWAKVVTVFKFFFQLTLCMVTKEVAALQVSLLK
jgi:hypothetical protein